MDDLLKNFRGDKVDPVVDGCGGPACVLMYTSGTTGKTEKVANIATGGYLAYVTGHVQSTTRTSTTKTCVLGAWPILGWITGHSYIVYGPLALAATSILFEGRADISRPGGAHGGVCGTIRRGISSIHRQTAIRMLRKSGPDEPKKYAYHFKHNDNGR